MFTRLRLAIQLFFLRFRGAVKEDGLIAPHPHLLKATKRNQAEDERILAEWFKAAEEVGIDLSPAAMAARYKPGFNSGERDLKSESADWRDATGNEAHHVWERLHQSSF